MSYPSLLVEAEEINQDADSEITDNQNRVEEVVNEINESKETEIDELEEIETSNNAEKEETESSDSDDESNDSEEMNQTDSQKTEVNQVPSREANSPSLTDKQPSENQTEINEKSSSTTSKLEINHQQNLKTLNKKADTPADDVYRVGSRADIILQLKTSLLELGYGDSSSVHWTNPDNYFGAGTKQALEAFQSDYNLPVTGELDRLTADKITEILTFSYKLGDKHEDIRELKTNLLLLGFGDPNSKHWTDPDTYFGKGTQQALEAFQAQNDLPVTGELDRLTSEKVAALVETSAHHAPELASSASTYDHSSFVKGQSHEKIRTLKTNLLQLGYGNPNSSDWTDPDSFFGPGTERALKSFQTDYGLRATGVLDQPTEEKIDSVLSFSYSIGDSHATIRELKTSLLQLGYGDPNSRAWTNPDKYFGPGTKQALEAFQADFGLPVTGDLDRFTANRIDRLVHLSYTPGERHEDIKQLKTDLLQLGYGDPSSKHWTNPDDYFGQGTKEALESFQADYGLPVIGILDGFTADKIERLISESLFAGESHGKIRQLKSDLLLLGYGNPNSKDWTDPDKFFGPGTKKALENFQRDFNLTVNGIFDPATENTMSHYIETSFFMGQSSEEVRLLKKDLLLMGYGNPNSKDWTNPDKYFGPGTRKALEMFQKDYNLPVTGIYDTQTAEKMYIEKHHNFAEYDLTLEQALNMQMKAYPQTDKPYAFVSADWIDEDGRVIADVLNVRSGPGERNSVLDTFKQGDEVTILSKVGDWYQIRYDSRAWVNAVAEDVLYYLNPENFLDDKVQMFQFLDLSKSSGATAEELNDFLKGKGIFDGMGEAFLEASKIHGVNEVYLISHALLESGHGTSQLATGMQVNGMTVYNMFGIGAIDSDPLGGGSQRAYEEGWTTPEKAIIGGARFIGNSYIKVGQNTLYTMRWNPYAMHSLGYATHQYATDIGWASKQVYSMNNLYNDIGIVNPFYLIPVYKK